MLICIIICSFTTIIIQSFSVEENVPTVWPHRQWSGLGSRPLPFDVAALFVHQRQRSARSHSTICHLLNPSPWLGRSSIVCVLHREVRNMGSCSHLMSLVQSAEIRCDFSPAFKSGMDGRQCRQWCCWSDFKARHLFFYSPATNCTLNAGCLTENKAWR